MWYKYGHFGRVGCPHLFSYRPKFLPIYQTTRRHVPGDRLDIITFQIHFIVNDQIGAQFFLDVSSNLVLIIRRINCINRTSGMCHSENTWIVYQRLYWYNWFSWWWARGYTKHVENWNKYIEKNCASSWSFTKNHDKVHGRQHINFQYVFVFRLPPCCWCRLFSFGYKPGVW
jgi:hypothetical protein